MTTSTKPHTSSGRYQRGEETKQRIIDAAVDSFSRHGFVGASTRDIAAAADVNTPALQYYFGGKLGLYNACLDYLTGRVWQKISPALQSFDELTDENARLDQVIVHLGEVQRCMIDSFFSDIEGLAIRRLLALEDAEKEECSSEEFLKKRVGLPIFKAFERAVNLVAPKNMSQLEAQLHGLSMMGMSMIFHFNQTRAMDLIEWPAIDDRLISMLKDVAHKQLAYALTGLAGAALEDNQP